MHRRIWFTRFKRGRKLLEVCSSVGGNDSRDGLHRIFGRDNTVAGQIDFDPTPLFITATNYKDSLNNLADINVAVPKEEDCFVRDTRPDHEHCRRKLSSAKITGNVSQKREHWDAVLQVAIPKFQFKRITQFDFVKNGGILIPAPFPEAALNNYTFTWDLRRVIAPTKTRLDAEDTIGAYKPKAQGSKFCIPILAAHENYISVADSFKIKDCRDLTDSIHAPTYRLGCLSEFADNSASAAREAAADEAQSGKKKFTMTINDTDILVSDTALPPKGDACRWGW